MSDVVVITVGVLTSLTLLVGLTVSMWRGFNVLHDIRESVDFARENRNVLDEIRKTITAELTTNLGTSLKDHVTALTGNLEALSAAHESHRELVDERHAALVVDLGSIDARLSAIERMTS